MAFCRHIENRRQSWAIQSANSILVLLIDIDHCEKRSSQTSSTDSAQQNSLCRWTGSRPEKDKFTWCLQVHAFHGRQLRDLVGIWLPHATPQTCGSLENQQSTKMMASPQEFRYLDAAAGCGDEKFLAICSWSPDPTFQLVLTMVFAALLRMPWHFSCLRPSHPFP